MTIWNQASDLPDSIRDGSANYWLCAVDAAGNALYLFRNQRMGGKMWLIRFTDGTTKNWGYLQGRPDPPPSGKWRWTEDGRDMAFGR